VEHNKIIHKIENPDTLKIEQDDTLKTGKEVIALNATTTTAEIDLYQEDDMVNVQEVQHHTEDK
jgi:hypothetical protein